MHIGSIQPQNLVEGRCLLVYYAMQCSYVIVLTVSGGELRFFRVQKLPRLEV